MSTPSCRRLPSHHQSKIKNQKSEFPLPPEEEPRLHPRRQQSGTASETSGKDPRQRQLTASVSENRARSDGIEQAPRHRTNVVEGLQGVLCPDSIDCTSGGEESQVTVDLFGRGIGDPPVVQPVSSKPAVAFSDVGRDRACRPDHLISYRFQRGGNPHDELDGYACCFEGFLVGSEVGVRDGSGLVTSGSFMLTRMLVRGPVSRVCRPLAGRMAPLTPAPLPAMPIHPVNDPEVTMCNAAKTTDGCR